MSKLGKVLTFVGISGAAVAGLLYFLDTRRVMKSETEEAPLPEDDSEDDEEEKEEPSEGPSYVSLNTDDITPEEVKDGLKKVVTEAVADLNAKAAEEADGVGVVKEEASAQEFEFKPFDESKDEDK